MTKSLFTIAILTLLLIGHPFSAACDPSNAAGAAGTVVASPVTTAASSATPGQRATTGDHRPTPGKWRITTPDKIAWQPTKLLPPGVQIAVLEGDPSKPGFFTLRLKVPDGYRFPAHWHASVERVTVLSGTLYLGRGDGSDQAAVVPLTAGTYSSMAPNTPHFAWTQGETILQVSSLGPWTLTYVNSARDLSPRFALGPSVATVAGPQ